VKKSIALTALVIAISTPALAQTMPSYYVLDAGTKIAGPFEAYNACWRYILVNTTGGIECVIRNSNAK
jgi:hypothetical protein